MSWLLLAVGLLTLGLGVNVLRPSRSLVGMVISFLAEWLASELAHWTILVLGAVVALLAAFGGLEHTAGWIGLVAACIGFVLLAIELWLGWRSGPTVVRELHGAGLGAPDPFRGRTLRLLFPFYFGDRRVRRIADVRYAEGAGLRHVADIYVPRNGVENAAVLLQIHGGAWLVGNKRQQGRPLMNRMAAAGWVCVAINYRLAPRHKLPDAIVDVKLALAWIHEHIAEYGGDPERIIVSGGSAGGHLAAMAALTVNDPEYQPGFESADTSVLACVPLYPPTDLLALFDYGGRWTRRMTEHTTRWVFGASPTEDPDRFRHWSPITLVRPGIVPFLVVQGTGDNLVPHRLTRAFVERLRAQPGQQVVYLELPGAPHAFEVFHSLRAEAAASAVHRFCSWVTANEMARELTAGRATSSDRATAADDGRIEAEAR
jgi:acetyl esterase/lipase